MGQDIGASFAKLKMYFCFNYRGVLVEPISGGVMWNRTAYYSKEELDKAIDERHICLGNSISRIKPVDK